MADTSRDLGERGRAEFMLYRLGSRGSRRKKSLLPFPWAHGTVTSRTASSSRRRSPSGLRTKRAVCGFSASTPRSTRTARSRPPAPGRPQRRHRRGPLQARLRTNTPPTSRVIAEASALARQERCVRAEPPVQTSSSARAPPTCSASHRDRYSRTSPHGQRGIAPRAVEGSPAGVEVRSKERRYRRPPPANSRRWGGLPGRSARWPRCRR